MKFALKFAGCLLCFIGFTACPYESELAISDPNCAIDTTLIGSWLATDSIHPGDSAFFDIHAFNKYEYFAECYDKKTDKKKSQLRAFESRINGIRILNVSELGKKQKFTFVKFQLNKQQISISYLSDRVINQKYKSRKIFLKAIKENFNNEKLFEENLIFKKIE